MAAIPGAGKDITDDRIHKDDNITISSASGSTARIYFDPGPTDATPWPFKRPPTLKEKRRETLKYFKSFKRR